jgi:acetyl-CoA carboxylase carboxyl transferase subunit alpha
LNFLDFEQPIAELEAKIEELQHLCDVEEINIGDEIATLQSKSKSLTESIFASLSPWQIAQLARHPQRPFTRDYIDRIFTEFEELHGDRRFAEDPALIGGPARLDGRPVMVMGHQKGRDTKEKLRRNFGMPRPEGYRKAERLMHLAERFDMPVFTFIDTPGAYPGIGAEERGQSEAIPAGRWPSEWATGSTCFNTAPTRSSRRKGAHPSSGRAPTGHRRRPRPWVLPRKESRNWA